jgi:hypothetical protein
MNTSFAVTARVAILCFGVLGVTAVQAEELRALSPALAQALEKAGWDARRSADGSLILRQAEPSREQPAIEPAQSKQADMFARLRDKGWRVETTADGSTLLYPPPSESAPALVQKPSPPPPAPEKTLDELLEERQWRVVRNADGSMNLYPKASPRRQAAIASTPIAPCEGWPLSSEAMAGVALPVDTWAEANALAQGWVGQSGVANLAVGRIRKVLRVYIVSIVASRPPHRLLHQIAVNTRDGRVCVLN